MTTPVPAKDKIILALDAADEGTALRLVQQTAGALSFYKVGLELFTRCGPGVIDKIRAAAAAQVPAGVRIFLDLKLHDIPNTVAGAVRSASALGIDLLTVHLSGGSAMLRAAQAEIRDGLGLLGVSVLTSSDESTLAETGVSGPIPDQVLRLAALGVEVGLQGIVASPLEARRLREAFGTTPVLVIPGVRPATEGSGKDDQRRTMTPRRALEEGADFLVIGRPISAAPDPRAAAEAIVRELA